MYIIAGLFNILQVQFNELDIDVKAIFAEFKTDMQLLNNPVERIDAGIMARYLERVAVKTQNRRVGLATGFIVPFGLTGTLFNVYGDCKTAADIFGNLDALDSTSNNITRYAARTDGDLLYYEISIIQPFTEAYPLAARQWAEMQYGIALQYAYSYTGRFLHPLFARSVYKREGDPDVLEDYLGCPVTFGENKMAMVFEKRVAALPVVTARKEFLPVFEYVMGGIRDNSQAGKLSGTVRRYLVHNLSSAGMSLEFIASRLNMTARTLQRKLRGEGTSYQFILNGIRIELAHKYLKERIPLPEIAFLLGFESTSAFNKFFRKHFNTTPGRFGARRKL